MKSQSLLYGAVIFLLSACNQPNTQQPAETTTEDSVKTQPPAAESKPSARPVHWGYEGEDGPAQWASLSPVYAACGEGKSQSPIDLVSATKATDGQNVKFDYKTSSLKIAHHEHVDEIIDNGHTIQVTTDEGSTLAIGDKIYHLKQFHFHSPSEHTVDGKHAPLEMHMVHQSDDGKLAVVSAMFGEGAVNENIQKIIEHFPAKPGDSNHYTDVQLDLSVHVPKDISAYHYSGSLTTPPCSEDVEWLVLRNKFTVSKEQVAVFSARLNNNNRPVQTLNERKVDGLSIKTGVQ